MSDAIVASPVHSYSAVAMQINSTLSNRPTAICNTLGVYVNIKQHQFFTFQETLSNYRDKLHYVQGASNSSPSHKIG